MDDRKLYCYKYHKLNMNMYLPAASGRGAAAPAGVEAELIRGGRVMLTEILLPRTARQGTVCLIPKI